MSHFQKHLILSASPEAVYAALSTQQGLSQWWTATCEADETVGGQARFDFNQTHKTMRIDRLEPGREVRWHCVQAHLEAPGIAHTSEWVGTDIVFRLSPEAGGGTRLEFEHIGLTQALQCFNICQSGWTIFLGSLKSLVETGTGQPFLPSFEACVH
ncbi:MAG: hypothetical protein RLZZ618_3669 [Pseudomonadota bacterium]